MELIRNSKVRSPLHLQSPSCEREEMLIDLVWLLKIGQEGPQAYQEACKYYDLRLWMTVSRSNEGDVLARDRKRQWGGRNQRKDRRRMDGLKRYRSLVFSLTILINPLSFSGIARYPPSCQAQGR